MVVVVVVLVVVVVAGGADVVVVVVVPPESASASVVSGGEGGADSVVSPSPEHDARIRRASRAARRMLAAYTAAVFAQCGTISFDCPNDHRYPPGARSPDA